MQLSLGKPHFSSSCSSQASGHQGQSIRKKQKRRGVAVGPHIGQREGKEWQKRGLIFLCLFQENKELTIKFCTKTWRQSCGDPYASPFPCLSPEPPRVCQKTGKDPKPQFWGRGNYYEKSGETFLGLPSSLSPTQELGWRSPSSHCGPGHSERWGRQRGRV